MLQVDALASSGQRQATSSTCHSYPPFTQAPQSGLKHALESGSTGADPGYVHTSGKVVVVKVCREFRVTS